MIQITVRLSDKTIVGFGYNPDHLCDDGFVVIDISDDHEAALRGLGIKTLNEDGTITVTEVPPPPTPDAAPSSAEQLDALVEQSKAVLEKASTIDDIKVIVGGLIDGMKDIYGTKSA